jgi:hypothetical protein
MFLADDRIEHMQAIILAPDEKLGRTAKMAVPLPPEAANARAPGWPLAFFLAEPFGCTKESSAPPRRKRADPAGHWRPGEDRSTLFHRLIVGRRGCVSRAHFRAIAAKENSSQSIDSKPLADGYGLAGSSF